jgi:hypothetical protein
MNVNVIDDESNVINFKKRAALHCGISPKLANDLSIRDLFSLAHSINLDLSKDELAVSYYLNSRLSEWIDNDGYCAWRVKSSGKYTSIIEDQLSGETRAHRQSDLGLLKQREDYIVRAFRLDQDYLNLLPESEKIACAYTLKSNCVDLIDALEKNPERNRLLIDRLLANRIEDMPISDALVRSALHMRLFIELSPNISDKNRKMSQIELAIDIGRLKTPQVALQCMERFEGEINYNFFWHILRRLEIGVMDAKEACAFLFSNPYGDKITPNAHQALNAKVNYDGLRVYCAIDECSEQVRQFWLVELPEAVHVMKDVDFSPLPGMLAHITSEVSHLDLINAKKFKNEIAIVCIDFERLIANSPQAFHSAGKYYEKKPDKSLAVDFYKRYGNPEHLHDTLQHIASSLRPVRLVKLRRCTDPFTVMFFEKANVKQFLLQNDDGYCAAIAREVLDIFNGRHFGKVLEALPGIADFIGHLANHEQWDAAKRFSIATCTRSWPVRKIMLEVLDVPASEYSGLPPAQRRKLLEHDLSL